MGILLWIVAICLTIAGIAGIFVPAMPGTLLVFAGLLVAAWADDFQKVGLVPLLLIGGLLVVSFALDAVATAVGVRRVGASPLAVVGATVGALVGLFFGLAGVMVGPFVGAALGEYLVRRDLRQSGRAGLGTMVGMVLAAAAKLGVVLAMIGIFLVAYLL